ncbi:MAG: hypothetical protein WDZ35_04455 [Crocinitomicaceae bacterium]
MKRGSITLITFALLFFTACKKNESDVQGMVRYVDDQGFYHTADSATIILYEKDTTGSVVMSTSTDEDGIYQIQDIADGQYRVYGELMIDSNTVYKGVSSKFSCKGAELVAAPFDLD